MMGSPAADEAGPAAVGVDARPQFSVRRVVARNLSLWAEHAAPFFLASLALDAPCIALSVARGRPEGAPSWLDAAELLLGVTFALATTSALTHGALQALGGARPRSGALVAAGLRVLPRVSLVALGYGLIVIVSALGLVAAFGGIRTRPSGDPVAIGVWAILILAGVAIGVTGAVAATGFVVAAPATVAEPELGALAGALRRSWSLTRRRRLRVLALGAIAVAAVVPLAALAGVASRQAGGAWYAANLAFWIASVVPFGAILTLPAVAYHALRLEKEGTSTDALAKVFD